MSADSVSDFQWIPFVSIIIVVLVLIIIAGGETIMMPACPLVSVNEIWL
jgi:hypothetical protein